MVTVTIYQPTRRSEVFDFTYYHNAVSWLVLGGFLILEHDDTRYANPYTGATAQLERLK